MRSPKFEVSILVLLACFFAFRSAQAANNLIHHDVSVTVDPNAHTIQVSNSVTLPHLSASQPVHFVLHSGLELQAHPGSSVESSESVIEIIDGPIPGAAFGIDSDDIRALFAVPVTHYRVTLRNIKSTRGDFEPIEDISEINADNPVRLTLVYSGKIFHPIESQSREYERSFSTSPGIICSDGVVLSGSSAWIPWFGQNLMTFDLQVDLPEPWISVSQGQRMQQTFSGGRTSEQWSCQHPMDDIYLIAAPFTETTRIVTGVSVMAFLRQPDLALATRYLDVTGQYLDMYNRLIGPYPYSKFALIENFWETGYGMPSFTLLGPTVIRLPFILHSSYPHELLHNWWGNSVYVDYESGNWCEGLTTCLADHLIKEQRGQGAEYRRGTLQKYTDYVNDGNDFPLSQFTSRIHAPSEAVGYGKSMMMFHMLRRETGDDVFRRILQTFYADHRFRYASFDDIRRVVEKETNADWSWFFAQWVTRPGAPQLTLAKCHLIANPPITDSNENVLNSDPFGTHILEITLEQVQDAPPYRLSIPVAVTLADQPEAVLKTVSMTQKQQTFRLEYAGTPVRVDVDPEFDVFRKLDRAEIPPALSQIFGADQVSVVLPESDSTARLLAYRELAETWAADSPGRFNIVTDNAVSGLPDGPVWLFGRQNRHLEIISDQLHKYGAVVSDNDVFIDSATVSFNDHALVFVVRHPNHPDQPIVWFCVDHPESLAALKRKLPHYGKYSFLAFQGAESTNILSGQWMPAGSPMISGIQDDEADAQALPPSAPVPERPALAELPAIVEPDRMMEHIRYLAGQPLEGRGLGSKGLEDAAQYIVTQFESAGLKPGGPDGSWFQEWQAEVDGFDMPVSMKNIIGFRPGMHSELFRQPVILCAHYDHLGQDSTTGNWFPGADDNASGVAVMCEIAARLSESAERDLYFIAFTGEETGRLGSKHFVQHYKEYPVENTFAVINLDGVGRFDNNRFLVIGAGSAREWPHVFMGCGHVTGVRSRMVAEPLDSSDQESFIEAGIPAVQVLSGPHRDYHTVQDTVDKINSDGLVKAVSLVSEAVLYLANRPDPFTPSMVNEDAPAETTTKRSVGTGSMPDFGFDGPGVRLADVASNSPADTAGLQAGDVLTRIDDQEIPDLKTYSRLLTTYQPGDSVTVEYIRGKETFKTKLILGKKAYQ